MPDPTSLFAQANWYRTDRGPRYQQLADHLAGAIAAGELSEGAQLPPERDLAELAGVSRVTVRKAVARLALRGLVGQRRGAGSFVLGGGPKVRQSLSSLVSFTQTLEARGLVSTTQTLGAGLFAPTPDEMMTLGLAPHEKVARLERLRHGSGTPVALETSSLPADVLPDPDAVGVSLYAVLRGRGSAPMRAMQRVSAVNVSGREAGWLGLSEGAAVLRIERTAYLETGRPIELTRGLYRPDIYEFVSEVRPEPLGAARQRGDAPGGEA